MPSSVWDILNSSLGILLIGSGIGFLFVHLLWEPMQSRRADKAKRQAIRDETQYRLYERQREFKDSLQGPLKRTYGVTLDPAYGGWSLEGLVYAGWGRSVLDACWDLIEATRSAPDVSAKIKALHELETKLFPATP